MTPAEHALIERARAYVRNLDRPGALPDLIEAVDVLDLERSVAATEQPTTYGLLVAGDYIQATSGRWYEVTGTTLGQDQTTVRVWLKGLGKPVEKFTGQAVTVRRSEMGAAVDVLASVVWSGEQGRRPAA